MGFKSSFLSGEVSLASKDFLMIMLELDGYKSHTLLAFNVISAVPRMISFQFSEIFYQLAGDSLNNIFSSIKNNAVDQKSSAIFGQEEWIGAKIIVKREAKSKTDQSPIQALFTRLQPMGVFCSAPLCHCLLHIDSWKRGFLSVGCMVSSKNIGETSGLVCVEFLHTNKNLSLHVALPMRKAISESDRATRNTACVLAATRWVIDLACHSSAVSSWANFLVFMTSGECRVSIRILQPESRMDTDCLASG